jgi:hypothetical protein
MGPRQQLHDEGRPRALDRLSSTFKHIHFATFDVDLNEADVFEGIAVERSYGDLEAQGSGCGPRSWPQASAKVQDGSLL